MLKYLGICYWQVKSVSETSRKIIQGVTELGAENGMYGMTSKAISKKCECSEGVIFKHFNTLDELKKQVN